MFFLLGDLELEALRFEVLFLDRDLGVLLGVTQVLAGTYFGPSAQLVAGYMLILFVLAVRPQGLFSR